MKKLTALLMIVSFVTVTAGSAFAGPGESVSERMAARRAERNQEIKRPPMVRHAPNQRPAISRPVPNQRQIISRPAPNQRPVAGFNRPIARPNSNFFNRAGRYQRPQYAPKPVYRPSHPRRHSSSSSLSGMELFGIGAAVLLLAAMVSN